MIKRGCIKSKRKLEVRAMNEIVLIFIHVYPGNVVLLTSTHSIYTYR